MIEFYQDAQPTAADGVTKGALWYAPGVGRLSVCTQDTPSVAFQVINGVGAAVSTLIASVSDTLVTRAPGVGAYGWDTEAHREADMHLLGQVIQETVTTRMRFNALLVALRVARVIPPA